MPGPPVDHLLEDRDVVDELEDRETAMEARLLGQIAQSAADLAALVGHAGVASEQPQHAAVGGEHSGQAAQQGGLAGAVGPEQAGDAVLGGEAEPGDRAHAPERLADAVCVHGGLGGHAVPPSIR